MRHADETLAGNEQLATGNERVGAEDLSGGRSPFRLVHRNALRRQTINLELAAAAPSVCRSFRARIVGTAESIPTCQADECMRGDWFTTPVDGRPLKMITREL